MKVEDYLTQEMIDKLQADVDDNNGVIDWSDLEPFLDGFKEQLLGVPKGTLRDETESNKQNSSIATYTENSKPEDYA